MYKRNNLLPDDYSEWAKSGTVYKCKKDIECKDGIFTKGSFVMLDVCSAEKSEIYVIDFASVLKNRLFIYTNDMTDVIIKHDIAILLPNQLEDCFDEAKELSYKINKHNKCIIWSSYIALTIVIILMIIWLWFKIDISIIVIALIITTVGMFGFNLVKGAKLSGELGCIITEDENNQYSVSQ